MVFLILILVLISGFVFEKWAIRNELNSLTVKGKLHEAAGTSMHMQCAGIGSPTVVLEAGLGSDMNSWDNIFEAISTFTQVCRYDRRGYGLSESSNKVSDIKKQGEELQILLNASGVTGSKILVGHSAGGLYIRQYLAIEPQIAGLVLVDSPVSLPREEFNRFFHLPNYTQQYYRSIAAKFSLMRIKGFFFPDPLLKDGIPKGWPSQNTSSSRYIDALFQDDVNYVDLLQSVEPQLGNIPMVVISRGKDFMNQGSPKSDFDIAWDRWQNRLLSLSSQSQHIIANESGHDPI